MVNNLLFRCELLLFFEIQIFVTASLCRYCRRRPLWIAFVLWNSDICHSMYLHANQNFLVVNCFCSLKFRYLSQPNLSADVTLNSCELLLFFEIQIFVTAGSPGSGRVRALWIAFVLWNSDICHSTRRSPDHLRRVVNCFCSLKFRYLSQQSQGTTLTQGRCELLLFFEIQIFVTAMNV